MWPQKPGKGTGGPTTLAVIVNKQAEVTYAERSESCQVQGPGWTKREQPGGA